MHAEYRIYMSGTCWGAFEMSRHIAFLAQQAPPAVDTHPLALLALPNSLTRQN